MSKEGIKELPGQQTELSVALKRLRSKRWVEGDVEFAKYLFQNGHLLNQTAVGRLLGNPTKKGNPNKVLKEYVELFHFSNPGLYPFSEHFFKMMKIFIDKAKLPEKEPNRTCIINTFAKKYFKDNKNNIHFRSLFDDENAVVQLVQTVLKLNDNLINPKSNEKEMTEKAFVNSLKNNNIKLSSQSLKKLYAQVKAEPIPREIEDMIVGLNKIIEKGYKSLEIKQYKTSHKGFLPSFHLPEKYLKGDIDELNLMVTILDKVKREPEALNDALNALQEKIQSKLNDKSKEDTAFKTTILELSQEIEPIIRENERRISVNKKSLSPKK